MKVLAAVGIVGILAGCATTPNESDYAKRKGAIEYEPIKKSGQDFSVYYNDLKKPTHRTADAGCYKKVSPKSHWKSQGKSELLAGSDAYYKGNFKFKD